jgi:rhomboid protease GluP
VRPEDERIRLVEALQRATPRVWVTPVISALLVCVFVGVTVASGTSAFTPSVTELMPYGANTFSVTVGRNEWWRLLAATGLHGGLLHLMLNVWAFWNAGALTERLFGNWAFLFIYVSSAIGGSIASLHWNQAAVSVGASGAVFGVYGALLAFVLTNRSALPPSAAQGLRTTTLGFIVLNLLIGLTLPFVDNSAHAGGLVVGFVGGWLLERDVRQPAVGRSLRIVAALGLTTVAGGAAATLRARLGPESEAALANQANASVERLLAEGTSRLRRGDAFGAIRVFDKALAQHPQQPDALTARATAHLAAGHFRAARDDIETAKANGGDGARLRTPLCFAAWGTGDLEETVRSCQSISPTESEATLTLARALAASGRPLEAHQAVDAAAEFLGRLDAPQVIATRAAIRLVEGFTADAVGLCRKGAVVFDSRALLLCVEVLRDAKATEALDSLAEAATSGLGKQGGDIALYRALALISLGEKSRALAGLDSIQASDATGLNNRAFVKVLAGDAAGALIDVEASLALEGQSAPALGTRCWAKSALGQTVEAIADCKAALALAPGTDADEGMLAFLQGDSARAVFLWRMAQKGDPLSAPLFQPFIDRAMVPSR